MGFFSDLKDDLSQAVNELKPEELPDKKYEEEETAGSYDMDADLADILDGLDEKYEAAKEEIKFDETAVSEPVTIDPIVIEPVNSTISEAYVAPSPASVSVPNVSTGRIAADDVSVIMPSMIINGNMATEGSLDIKGSVVGNVEALGKLNITGSIQGNSSASEIFAEGARITGEVKSMGSIKIGQSTTIIGNVFATSAVIAGAVKGDIDVKGPVILDATAIVLGNIKSKAVQINNGAVIEGLCSQCYAEVNPISFFEELKKMK